MPVSVKYFASLREQTGKDEEQLEWHDSLTPGKIWSDLNTDPMPEKVLIAINQEYAKTDSQVNDGDEVAFFPPVTGG